MDIAAGRAARHGRRRSVMFPRRQVTGTASACALRQKHALDASSISIAKLKGNERLGLPKCPSRNNKANSKLQKKKTTDPWIAYRRFFFFSFFLWAPAKISRNASISVPHSKKRGTRNVLNLVDAPTYRIHPKGREPTTKKETDQRESADRNTLLKIALTADARSSEKRKGAIRSIAMFIRVLASSRRTFRAVFTRRKCHNALLSVPKIQKAKGGCHIRRRSKNMLQFDTSASS